MDKALINELKSFFVERYVDNMDTKDLVEYVYNDMDKYVDGQTDDEFLKDAKDYWGDYFGEVIDEVQDYMKCDFKKSRAVTYPIHLSLEENAEDDR